jgi:uncharacterized membrane protein YcaP (DUF421 family)
MESVIRVVLVYLVILVGLRVLGKREFGELSPLELITLMLIPDIVAPAVTREDFSFTNSVIVIATLFSLVFITAMIRYLSQKFETVVIGEPVVLVSHGSFIESNLHKERIDAQEIYGEMHKSGLYSIEQVKWAIIETDGKISIIPRDDS